MDRVTPLSEGRKESENTTVPPEGGGERLSPWRLVPLAFLLAGLVAFFATGLDDYLSFEMLNTHRQDLVGWVVENRLLSIVAFIGLYAVATLFSLPGGVWLTISGGFMFGTVEGALFSVIGATFGATGIFLLARYALGDYFAAKAGPAVRRMEEGFRENAFSYLMFLRLVPAFPFWLVNLVPAFLGVPLRTYVICTFLGIIPGGAVYAAVGNGLGAVIDAGEVPDLGIVFKPEVLAPLIGLALLSLVPVFYKKFRNRR
ncbi:MAG: TVP38/TMEM64 family protein [Rhodospirillales bacterium]|nr:TVP38/TMEM64 family protein [Rhodospirillales bacterium]MCW8952738.1 TVP38/TMEM64 family protein [Rhodospirillales bacterium]MCW9002675.1 TVP38/TMEM64 family protein [Rhodospirillales bacterium]